jgi:subtilisin-like proprotein convertase family protein/subtilisin family serine protease
MDVLDDIEGFPVAVWRHRPGIHQEPNLHEEESLMTKKRLTKKEEGSRIMRGGEVIEVAKAEDQFTVLFKPGTRFSQKPALQHAVPEQKLADHIELFKVPSEKLDQVMDEVRKDKDALFAHHVYSAKDDPASRVVLTDQIIAKFKEEVSDEEISTILQKYHLEIVEAFDDSPNSYLLRVTPDSGANPIKISNRLHAEGLTEYAEPNLVMRYQRYFEPTDTRFAKQWHLKNRGGVELLAGADVDSPGAWDITTGSRSVTVAIIDDGFDLEHPDLQGEGKIVAPMDFYFRREPTELNPNPEVLSDTSPYPEGEDYHGTPCAGVAVAELGRGEVVGVAPDCSLMPIRWPLFATDRMVAAMFAHAYRNGAAVISNSWGPGKGYHPINSKFQQVLHDAATKGRGGKGCVILFAAGNDNIPIDGTLDGTRHFNGETAHPDVMAIAASTSLNKKAAYSGWGAEISVCAPSNNFWPGDVSRKLPGRGIVTTDNGRHGSGFDPTLYTERFGGTSSATPLAAGVAALVISANPALTATQVREILESTADKIEDLDADPELGLRKGTYDGNGHSEWFGYGKVNAARAVRRARELAAGAGTRTIRSTRSANLEIPDADSAGIVSRIDVQDRGRIQSLRISVDIVHSYIGDLRVTLVAPDGERILVHNRQGGSSNDLRRSFDLATTPDLAQLVGSEVGGVWSLEIADLARWDVGSLRQWSLEAEIEDDGSIWMEAFPGLRIPDNDPNGVSDRLTVGRSRTINDLRVEVDITHSWIGDLRVVLIGPTGERAVLHDRQGSNADNIERQYDPASTPELGAFSGLDSRGVWTLSVSDHAGQDIGKLNRWALRIL